MVRLLVTYMEQQGRPAGGRAVPRPGARIAWERPDAVDYLALYRAIGGPVQWDGRLRMAAADLAACLADPRARFAVLHLDGARVGLCESYAHADGDIEIVHFGVVPEVQGRGLGPFLLDRALAALWDLGPRRIWLHTDTNDHPRAVATYERAGFRTWQQQWQDFPD